MYVLSFGLKIKNKEIYFDYHSGRLFYQTFDILRSKPDLFIYTKFGFSINRKAVRKIDDFSLFLIALKVKLFENVRAVRFARQKLQNNASS